MNSSKKKLLYLGAAAALFFIIGKGCDSLYIGREYRGNRESKDLSTLVASQKPETNYQALARSDVQPMVMYSNSVKREKVNLSANSVAADMKRKLDAMKDPANRPKFAKTSALSKMNSMFSRMHSLGLLPKEIGEDYDINNVNSLRYWEDKDMGTTNALYQVAHCMTLRWKGSKDGEYFASMNINSLPDGTPISGVDYRNSRESPKMMEPDNDVSADITGILMDYFNIDPNEYDSELLRSQKGKYHGGIVSQQEIKPLNQARSDQSGIVSILTTSKDGHRYLTDVRVNPKSGNPKSTQIDKDNKLYYNSPSPEPGWIKQ